MTDVLKALSSTPWLSFMDPAAQAQLSQSARLVSFRPGRRVMRSGEAVREVFFVIAGTVRLGAPVLERGATLVALRGAGAVLGAGEVLANDLPKADAVTLEAVTLVGIPSDVFLRLMETERRFTLEVCRQLALLAQNLQEQAGLLAPLPVALRLRQLLLRYAATCGTVLEDGVQLRPKLTQASLAMDLGVERKSVLRAMDQLREAGLLDKRNARYHLPSPQALESWSPSELMPMSSEGLGGRSDESQDDEAMDEPEEALSDA
jgi:CRP-like cAMP-binding protein